jgi:two-component system response regulator PilR (NtrC family)
MREARIGTAIAIGDPGKDALPAEGVQLDVVLASMERHYFELALERTQGNKTRAASLLGMSFRSFRYRLAKCGLEADG